MSRLFTLGSILIHGVVITGVFVAQLVAVGPLPIPHRALIFENPRLVALADIELPPPRLSRTAAPSETVSYNAAPLAPPAGIIDETGREGTGTRSAATGPVIGVDGGTGGLTSIGTVEGVELPPAPRTPQPQTPVRLHAGIEAPRKVANVPPLYPPVARLSRVEGIVVLEAVIDARGNVESVRVLKSIPALDQAAVEAVRQWRFTAARLNGQAIPVVMTVTVNFSLQSR